MGPFELELAFESLVLSESLDGVEALDSSLELELGFESLDFVGEQDFGGSNELEEGFESLDFVGEQDFGGSNELEDCELLDGVTDELEESGSMLSLLITSFKTTLTTCTCRGVYFSHP